MLSLSTALNVLPKNPSGLPRLERYDVRPSAAAAIRAENDGRKGRRDK
jgi:hypothetical protein